MNSTEPSWLKDILLITLILSIVYGVFLGTRPLMAPDEGRYAEIAREMVSMGNYLTPHLNGITYFEKPPLFYWIERTAIQWFGLNQWSLRLFPALIGIFGCLAVYGASRKLYNRTCGLLASLILGSSMLYATMSHFINPDLTLTVCLSLCLLCFILGTRNLQAKHYFWGMYGFAALATLTKGLIGLIFPGMIIFVWLALFNHWRQLKHYCIPSGILLFLVITLPWHLAVQIKNPEFFQFYFIDQHFLRYLTDYSQRKQPIWFFPLAVIIGFSPWICFFLTSIRLPQRRWFNTLKSIWQQRHQHEITIFFVIWFIVILLFFTLSQSLLFSYALPTLPPLAILLAYRFTPYWQPLCRPGKKPGSMAQEAKLSPPCEVDRCIHAGTTPDLIKLGFIFFTLAGLTLGLAGLIVVHPESVGPFHKTYWYISLALLAASSLLPTIAYKLWGFKAGFITLFTGISLCYASLNLSYPTIDHRSIKPLALVLRPLLTPSTEVAAYHRYYQDLPVYLERTVTVVNYQGELAFGMQHQDTHAWMLDEASFWKHWQNSPQMYMIMNLKEYKIKKDIYPYLYPLAKTPQNILVTNKLS